MKALLLLLSFALFPTAIASAAEFDRELPPHLEIVSQDSLSITAKNGQTGEISTLLWEPGGLGPGGGDWGTPIPLDADSCFSFETVGHIRHSSRKVFGDCDHDGLVEIAGVYGGRTWIYEYSGQDTTYIFQDTLYDTYPLDYGHDSDGDGLLEYLAMSIFHEGFTIYESPSHNSLPIDSIFAWPYGYYWGGIGDIDSDGQMETYLKRSFNLLEVWRNTGDNAYAYQYEIPLRVYDMPESVLVLFSGFVFGDFDSDGRAEMVNTSDRGVVLVLEWAGPDSLVETWRGQVSHYNANHIVGPADMDGDGHKEFVIQSNSISAGGFFYYFFESIGDNQFHQVYVDSIPGNAWDEGPLGLWDFDADGTEELAVCYYGGQGLYEAVGDNQIQLVYRNDVYEGYEMYVYDTNGNGLGEMHMYGGSDKVLEYTRGRGFLGDINGDCAISLADPLYLVRYLEGRASRLPRNIYAADVNGNCRVNGVDVLYYVNYFRGGPPPKHGGCLYIENRNPR